MRFVEPKSEEQQACAVLFRARERLLHQRTELVNALRSVLFEYGHVFPKGIGQLKRIEAALADPASDLPDLVRDERRDLLEQISEQTTRIEAKTTRARCLARTDDTAWRLQTMPGVGPQTTLAISSFAPSMDSFKLWVRFRGLARPRATSRHLRREAAPGAYLKSRPNRHQMPTDHWSHVALDCTSPKVDPRGLMAGTPVAPQAPHAGRHRTGKQNGAGHLGNDNKERGL